MSPIPISQILFAKIAQYARIPLVYSEILSRNTAMTVHATPQLPPTYPPLSPANIRKEYLSFIFQSIPGAASGGCASISVTYHFPTRHTYVFMHCLYLPMMSSGQNFFTAVEQSRLTLTTPLLILSVLIRYNLEFRLGALNRAHEDIYSFEKGLGIRYDHPEEVHMGTLDFGHFTKGLNAVTADLAYMAWSGGNTQRQLGFLDGVAEKYKDLALVNGHKEDDAEEVRVLLLESHAHLRCWNMGLEARGEYLSKRAQALVQTVYSGIAQRDAALSHNAAIASAQDSAVMRVIAAITIIFLPATTTATFFSTTFFDFKVGRHERVYSWWLWLYWVVTIALTALVLAGAVFWWRKKEFETTRRVGKVDKPEKGAKQGEED